MIILSFSFSHLHPVIVHLPIGMLMMAIVLEWLGRRPRHAALRAAIPITLLAGSLTAIFSVVTGLLLSGSGEYDSVTLQSHKWFAIGATVVGALAWYFSGRPRKRGEAVPRQGFLSVLLFVLLIITGHLGGSLTHGGDYLFKNLSPGGNKGLGRASETKQSIGDVQQAKAYADLVAPILEAKCVKCHGPSKQKGKLRLDQPEFLLRGGEDGPALVAGQPDRSDLIHRLMLPREDDDHMPPKEKPQLTGEEIKLLHWWIATGADFSKPVRDLPQDDAIRQLLQRFQQMPDGVGDLGAVSEWPDVKAPPAPPGALDALRKAGVTVLPLARDNNLLSVSFLNRPDATLKEVRLLEPIAQQVASLRLSHARIPDSTLMVIARLPNLSRLYLDHTNIDDKGLAYLQSLPNLRYLNLVGTSVTAHGLAGLGDLPQLKKLFIYQSGFQAQDWTALAKALPGVAIDTGNYHVPTWASDTALVAAPKK